MYDPFPEYVETYLSTITNKARGKEACEFSIHWQKNLLVMIEELRAHTYLPSAYAFIKKKPCPREIIASEFSLIVNDTHVNNRICPLLESRMTDRTFNNRVGYGTVAAINSVISDIYEVSEGFTNDNCVIFKLDMKGYFPNAVQDISYGQLSSVLEDDYHAEDKELMRQLLLRCLFSYPTDHCRKISPLIEWADYPRYKSAFLKEPGIGAAIGRPIWQTAMSYYLNDFDHFMLDICGLHYTRYEDDIVVVTDNKESFLALIPRIREELAKVGCELHPKKFYCQHYSKGVEFLGAYIKKDRVYPSRRTVRNFAAKIRYFNKRVRIRNLPSFIASMNSYLGILKGRNAHKLTLRMIRKINPDWWRFCHFNPERVCIQPNEGYTEKEILYRKYNLKIKPKYQKNGNRKSNRRAGGQKAGAPVNHDAVRRSGCEMLKDGDIVQGDIPRRLQGVSGSQSGV